jgi:hypothetical protein
MIHSARRLPSEPAAPSSRDVLANDPVGPATFVAPLGRACEA